MRAIALFLIVFLILPFQSPFASPLTLFGKVARYTLPLYEDAAATDGICTAVVVEHWLISATHCFQREETLYLSNGTPVSPVKTVHDLALLHAVSIRGLQLASHHPPPGTPTWAFGYGWGEGPLMMTPGSIVSYPQTQARFGIPMQRYDGQVIGGMSGGPVVTLDGRFVTQVSFGRTSGPAEILYGLPLDVFRGALRNQ